MRMVHSYDPTTAMAVVDILYAVGARNESPRRTGIAHLFEHLMFGGSLHAPSFDNIMETAGGRNNAWTSNDFTNFYDVVPAQNLDTALFLESDRMMNLNINEDTLRVQKGVVTEEFKEQCLDRPYGRLYHNLREMTYGAGHPYSWPTIGLEMEHIADASLDEARAWYEHHYAPNNAIISITGNVDFDTACRRVEHWWADVPARSIDPFVMPDTVPATQGLERTVYDNIPQPLVVLAYPMAAYGKPGYFAADTITDLLSAGRSTRLPQNIVEGRGRGIVNMADACILGSEGPGLLVMMARTIEDSDEAIEAAKRMLMEEAHKLTDASNIGVRELEKTFNNFEASFRFSNIGYLARATNLATALYHGEDINRTVTERRALTREDIASTARQIFAYKPTTLVYRPKKKE